MQVPIKPQLRSLVTLLNLSHATAEWAHKLLPRTPASTRRLREDSFVPHSRYRNGKFIYLHAEFMSVGFMKASRRRYAKPASSSDLNMERAYGWKTLM